MSTLIEEHACTLHYAQSKMYEANNIFLVQKTSKCNQLSPNFCKTFIEGRTWRGCKWNLKKKSLNPIYRPPPKPDMSWDHHKNNKTFKDLSVSCVLWSWHFPWKIKKWHRKQIKKNIQSITTCHIPNILLLYTIVIHGWDATELLVLGVKFAQVLG